MLRYRLLRARLRLRCRLQIPVYPDLRLPLFVVTTGYCVTFTVALRATRYVGCCVTLLIRCSAYRCLVVPFTAIHVTPRLRYRWILPFAFVDLRVTLFCCYYTGVDLLIYTRLRLHVADATLLLPIYYRTPLPRSLFPR